MRRCRVLLILALSAWWTAPADAGIIFNKHAKTDPATRVPALVSTLKSDQDEKKRTAAALELRNFDPNTFPEIVPVLIEAAQSDAKPGVRMEALNSLGKLRPVSQQVGQVLEQVVEKDNSWRVRVHARSVLLHYHLGGFRSAKNVEGPSLGVKTEEPPLADPPAVAPTAAPAPQASRLAPVPQPSRLSSKPQGLRPLPVGPVVEAPVLIAPPSSANSAGPELAPPK